MAKKKYQFRSGELKTYKGKQVKIKSCFSIGGKNSYSVEGHDTLINETDLN